MIHVKAVSVGPIATNCYIVYDDATNDAFIIDPGCETDFILEQIEHLNVKHILLTHAHWDHIGGVETIREHTDAPVYIHEIERSWLTDPTSNLSGDSNLAPAPVICRQADIILFGDEQLELLGETIRVVHTPGHSPGHVSYIMGDVIFGGDVLFLGSVGRTDLPGSDFGALVQSINSHFLSLPGETTVLPGHGPPTTIKSEQASNPFLQPNR